MFMWLKNIFLTVYLLIWIGFGCLLAFWFIYTRPSKLDWFLQYWSLKGLKSCGISVKLMGQCHLPDQGSVILFNHTSLLDILVLQATLGSCLPIRFGAKRELFHIPIFAFFMWKIGTLPITRSTYTSRAAQKTRQVYQNAISRIHRGENFVLSPEGGRFDGVGIGQFKSGPFMLAIQAQAPVVPVVIRGHKDILPRKNFFLNLKSSDVKVSILPAVSTKGLDVKDRHSLKDKVQELFIEELRRPFII